MTIQCPNCLQECFTPDTVPPGELVEVRCDHCRLSFTVRPHESPSPPAAANAPPEPFYPEEDPAPSFPLPGTLHRIPSWMAEVHDAPPAPVDEPHVRTSEAGIPFQEQRPPPCEIPPAASEIPLIVDDGLGVAPVVLVDDTLQAEDGPSLPQAPLPAAPPATDRRRAGRGIVDRPPRRRWLLPAALAAGGVCAVLLLVVLAPEGAIRKTGEAARSLLALLPGMSGEEGALSFSEYKSEFVARGSAASPLFVIEGRVVNNHTRPCHSVQVRGILFDERGKRASEETAYCGNILTRKELTTEPEEAIRKRLQNPMGSNLSNFDIQPGKAIPFMLVFFQPPDKLSEFSLEIAAYHIQEATAE